MSKLQEYQEEINKYKKRFLKANGVIKVSQPEEAKKVDAIELAFIAALHLLVRAKFLFLAILREDKSDNAYACYSLVRAYFETTMALGYLAIVVEKKANKGDFEAVFEISRKILLGGKYFPTEEALKQFGKERVDAINVYDYIDEVDKDFKRIGKERGKNSGPSMHREVYNTILSEYGHPNFLGLSICSDATEKEQVIYLNRSLAPDGREGYFNYVVWSSSLFFFYWQKLESLFKTHKIDLPSLE